VSSPKLVQLNQNVPVKTAQDELSENFLSQFKVVVLTGEYEMYTIDLIDNKSLDELDRINQICRNVRPNPVRTVIADTRGIFGVVFCDFGEKFTIYDKDGEEPLSSIVSSITKVSLHLFQTYCKGCPRSSNCARR
jgi:ubiquitin-activating enzyme E1